jgi:uncharacterized protein YndB with AHSA1/START domain
VTTSAHDTIEIERRINARPETVFEFFTDADKYRRWQGVEAELDARPGGIFRVITSGQSRTVARGEFVEVQPPDRLVFTWGWEDNPALAGLHLPPGSSLVEVLFEPDGDGTIVRLRHSGLRTAPSCQFHTWGWDVSLDRLVLVAQEEDPGPDPFVDL